MKLIDRLFYRRPPRPRYTYPCPVCGFLNNQWIEPLEALRFSYDICPCCFNEFGYDDFSKSHEELRAEWIANGMKWECDITLPPRNWNPREQLKNLSI